MASSYPNKPFRIDDATPICQRLLILEDLIHESLQDPSVQAFAQAIWNHTQALCQQFAQDPSTYQARQTQEWQKRILALEVLRAGQSLAYVPDPAEQEWFQPVWWTIRYGGDCEDLASAVVALGRILGLETQILWVTQEGHDLNHVTAQIKVDGQWLWADPSIRGAMLGETPYEAADRKQASHVLGGAAPAGATRGGGGGRGVGFGRGGFGGGIWRGGFRPFPWVGWNTIWAGWPASWWSNYYPYLYAPYDALIQYPYSYGFYPPRMYPVIFTGV